MFRLRKRQISGPLLITVSKLSEECHVEDIIIFVPKRKNKTNMKAREKQITTP